MLNHNIEEQRVEDIKGRISHIRDTIKSLLIEPSVSVDDDDITYLLSELNRYKLLLSVYEGENNNE